MKRILQIGRDGKTKRARIKDLQKLPSNELEMDVKLEFGGVLKLVEIR